MNPLNATLHTSQSLDLTLAEPRHVSTSAVCSYLSYAPVNQAVKSSVSPTHQMTQATSRDRTQDSTRQQEYRHDTHVILVHPATRHADGFHIRVRSHAQEETGGEPGGEDKVTALVSKLPGAWMRNAGDGFKQGSGWWLNIHTCGEMAIDIEALIQTHGSRSTNARDAWHPSLVSQSDHNHNKGGRGKEASPTKQCHQGYRKTWLVLAQIELPRPQRSLVPEFAGIGRLPYSVVQHRRQKHDSQTTAVRSISGRSDPGKGKSEEDPEQSQCHAWVNA
ncbi:hypothetical protein BO94DRAFT_546423 [Aspergillus sclerotioniger CBS 115572]|uniref:Uncharacterized protein n=1 Tax=Aspergillus sclerotioniger CBS 115572 TaxID=1450535 RepID=A0A317WL19_9EURO|nr:hypothetical protein BO94DRAFT_546423 [Aspergillus sclerotioniger CBS 115572]PWY87196.1 hypothetical protein BO94DRAFT_546423 [Aspergillus sclerotioniger CBS 115572]